jgi:hypothetical protein
MIDCLKSGQIDAPAAGQVSPLAEAWAAMEHRFGVLPLLETFFAVQGAFVEVLAGVFSGKPRGALGLFTPAPEPGWGAAAVAGEPSGGGLLLQGDIRLPGPTADGSIVLVRLPEEEHRLAWVDHGAPGVERRGSRTGGPAGDGPCWLHIEGAAIGPDLVSRPVKLAPDGELSRHLAAYAGVWASAAAVSARDGVRALRRAARTAAFQTSQLVALGITEVEIEADMTFAAAQRHAGRHDGLSGLNGLLIAAAAARTLSAVVRKTEELRDSFGLEIDGPLAGGSARTLTAFLGGSLVLESELARALRIGEGHER